MQKIKGIAMTDGLNRKDHFIPFESMMKAYEEAWERGGPTNLKLVEKIAKLRYNDGYEI